MPGPALTQIETDHRLPDRVDVVVIGGGIIGVMTALELVERGVSVLVCDKGQIGAEQPCAAEIRAVEARAGEVGPVQAGGAQIGAGEVEPAEVEPVQPQPGKIRERARSRLGEPRGDLVAGQVGLDPDWRTLVF